MKFCITHNSAGAETTAPAVVVSQKGSCYGAWNWDGISLRHADPKSPITEEEALVPSATAGSASPSSSTAALSRLVAIAAKHRPVAPRLKRNSRWLAAARADHRRTLCRSRTIAAAGTPLVVFLCHSAWLAAFWCRITTFLKERLICSGEGKVLPAVAASELNISCHGVSSCGDCTAPSANFA
jgi:hypothetical protein